ncbi:MAG: ABC transporter permease subunit [Anaerococcus sp.]|uniref:ABC transporter permease subunit n=1 Tax=Anaerococcus sp. TaxID=1872515 RepID=UPI002909C9A5|nr:ABC transporter permease subunit [Anaerococcus sp.]MDU4025786.1 ABC transporter permease subunit [Anaerococcus sp.]
MNKTFNKSLKSYGKFLKSYLRLGFTFSNDLPNIDNGRRLPEDDKLDKDVRKNLNNPNSNVGAGPDPTSENKDLKEEEILSPGKVAVKNFFRNPLGVIGLIMFVAIILLVFIGSAVFPFNQYYSQGNLTNVAPGGAYMNFPKEMEKEGSKKISIGNTFAVGLTNEDNVYVWGSDNEDKVLTVPSEVKKALQGKKVIDVAAGDRHILVATEDNEIFGWGNNSFDQIKMPPMQENQIKTEGIEKLGAGVQYSVVLTKAKNLVVWGSTMASRLNLIPSDIQGQVEDFDTSPINMLVAKTDGTIQLLGVLGAENQTTMPKELTDGSTFVKKVALTSSSAAAIDEDGKLYVWGPSRDALSGDNVPEFEAPIVDIQGADTTFTALDENGKLYSWGKDNYGELKTPDGEFEQIYASYFNQYAVDKEGNIKTWGLNGFRFGSDDQGRDIFTRLIHGGRMTMIISLISTIIQVVLGVAIGMISGFAGGRVDNILMRVSEIISSFPFYPMLISLSALLPPGASQTQRITMVMVLLGLLGWTGLARLVRGQILAERERDYITAARALGVKNSQIMIKHILPNILSIVIVNATLAYAGNLLTESGLSFLGFGVQEPTPSWGNMLSAAQSSEVLNIYWWRWVFPALAVFLVSFSVNLIGDAIRDAIDPRANER